MSLYITDKRGVVHGGEAPCPHARDAAIWNKHKPVRLSQVIVHKLAPCGDCFTVQSWDALLTGRVS